MSEKSNSTIREIADCYQELWNHMNQDHGLILTISEMDDIINESQKVITKINNLYENTGATES
jgi:hypothetical protein